MTWRAVIVVAVAVVALFWLVTALANWELAVFNWLGMPNPKVRLGLDLQGGIHLVLQVQTDDALKAEIDDLSQRLVSRAKDDGITLGAVTVDPEALRFTVAVPANVDRDALNEVIDATLPEFSVSRGAEQWTFTLPAGIANNLREMAIRQALETIRNRVDQFGVSEPIIQRQGMTSNRILVQLPGVDDPARVKDLIGKTAFLEFQEVVAGPAADRESLLRAAGGMIPPDAEVVTGERTDIEGNVIGKDYYLLKRASIVTGRDLRTARRSQDDFNQPNVLFELVPASADKFADYTGSHIGTHMAIVLDNNVSSAPRINDRIRDSGVIEGSFTIQEAEDLALVLRAGALPASITYLEERTVGPSLGLDSIQRGWKTALLSLIVVSLFMVVYYRMSGVNAVVALILNLVIIMAVMAGVGATLTLPGIAGLVLTIGMAVDANVLIFERIREELAVGKTVRSAIEAGFARAFSAIVDSNVTTLIAALFLFQFGTGPVKGFAVTLSIGLFTSVYTAVFVSLTIFMVFVLRKQRVQTLSI